MVGYNCMLQLYTESMFPLTVYLKNFALAIAPVLASSKLLICGSVTTSALTTNGCSMGWPQVQSDPSLGFMDLNYTK